MTPSDAIVPIASGLRFHSTPWTVGLSVALAGLVAAVCLAAWWRSGFRPGIGLVELARLAVAHGDVVPDDALIDDLWRGTPPPSARVTVVEFAHTTTPDGACG